MENKTSLFRTSYQECGSNAGRVFGRDSSNTYDRGQGQIFYLTKPKAQGNCESLVSNMHSIEDARQAGKYTKMTER